MNRLLMDVAYEPTLIERGWPVVLIAAVVVLAAVAAVVLIRRTAARGRNGTAGKDGR